MQATLFLGIMTLLTVPLAAADWRTDYAALLAKYSVPWGLKYAEWKANAADTARMAAVVEAIGATDASQLPRDAALAHYLNAYNAWTVQIVLEAYPIRSITTAAGIPFLIFKSKRIVVDGRKTSLERLEKDIIIKRFQEPRIHMAINCASISCPPLSPLPFTAENLEAELTRLTRDFAETDRAVVLDPQRRRLELNPIFNWYAEDFAAAGGPVAFLNRYRAESLPTDWKVDFFKYDWNLNGSDE